MGKERQGLGVTVVTVTNKRQFMRNLFQNFKHQTWGRKELIVVLNHDKLSPAAYQAYAKRIGVPVRVFRMPQETPLGPCLNLGIRHAKHAYVAKLDDDDYYAPAYLGEAMRTATRTGADILGKYQFYMYMEKTGELVLGRKGSHRSVAGATLVFRRSMYPKVKFTRRRAGSDMKFLEDALKKGYRLRSTSQYHFAAVRRADQSTHTWKVNKMTLRNMHAKVVARTKQFRGIVRGLKR